MADARRYLESWCSGEFGKPIGLLHPLMPDQLWDMMEGKELFQHIHDQKGRYDAKLHIAEMIALIGSPPPEIIQRYQYMREYAWPTPVRRKDDILCETAEEYFCGPFFDEKGIYYTSLSWSGFILRLTTSGLLL